MEKAILKTLIYADIFDYPLTIFEIHKWLIGKKTTLRQLEKALERLRVKGQAVRVKNYYFLPRRLKIISQRQRRQKQAREYFKKAKFLTTILRIIPWIKLVGVSGGLAMENTQKKDDIDLFIITSKNRLWITRLLTLLLFSIVRQRRKVGDRRSKVAGKLCLNIILEEDRLAQNRADIYLAHEVLQMKVLWQRGETYRKYLEENQWAFKFLPNWRGSQHYLLNIRNKRKDIHNVGYLTPNIVVDIFEDLAKKFQLKIMVKPQGMERIEHGALYFHPQDCRQKILKQYRLRIKKISRA